jgi:hypothetical protein
VTTFKALNISQLFDIAVSSSSDSVVRESDRKGSRRKEASPVVASATIFTFCEIRLYPACGR